MHLDGASLLAPCESDQEPFLDAKVFWVSNSKTLSNYWTWVINVSAEGETILKIFIHYMNLGMDDYFDHKRQSAHAMRF